jgi:tRNA(fMet)-specific endonuclease VapC
MSYLIDTDWAVDFLARRAPAVSLVGHLILDGVAMSAITYMEVVEGVRGSRDPRKASQGLANFMASIPLLPVDDAVGERAADIRLHLRRQKRQVHERALDIIIAATAIEHGLTLATRNTRHYQDIPGLLLDAGT